MFFFLRRIAQGLVAALLLLLAWFLFQQRHAFTPAVDLAVALNNWRETDTQQLGRIEGTVERILSGHSFVLRSSDGQRVQVVLKALEPCGDTRETLHRFVQGQPVEVEVSFSQQNSVIGVAYLGKTNLNTLLIEQGAARLERSFLPGLPVLDQYRLLRVDRRTAAKSNEPKPGSN